MFRLLPLILLTSTAFGVSLPPVPYQGQALPQVVSVAGLKPCTVGDTRVLLDAGGRVRALQYARLIPDNALRVTQSYDRAGRLSGIQVKWTGFAGPLLDVRGAFDSRGQLVKETGYRQKGVSTPLRSYLRPIPRGVKC